jgi:acyl-CoA thioester hydrolase
MTTESGSHYVQNYRVGWGEIDGNGHMANTAYLDRAADTRFRFFAEHGFPAERFGAERIGPVIVRDEVTYRKELRLMEAFSVDLRLTGLSSDRGRFELTNTFHNSSGDLVAVVTSEGVWFDLSTRRPRPPPQDLASVQQEIPRGEEVREIRPRRP